MPWRIPSARYPRCTGEIRAVELMPVPVDWLLADEDAATLWPRGRAGIPAGVNACAACQEELRGYEDQCRWEREARLR